MVAWGRIGSLEKRKTEGYEVLCGSPSWELSMCTLLMCNLLILTLTNAISPAPKSVTSTNPLTAADQFVTFSAADPASGLELLVSGASDLSVGWGDEAGAGDA